MQHRITMHWKPNHTTGQDVTQPAISALDHLAIDAGTQHTAPHQEVFFQGARLHHQGRPCVRVVLGVGAHLRGEAPCRQIPQRHWTLATGTGGLRRMGKPGRRKTQLGVSSAAKTADLLFSPNCCCTQCTQEHGGVYNWLRYLFFLEKPQWEVFLALP